MPKTLRLDPLFANRCPYFRVAVTTADLGHEVNGSYVLEQLRASESALQTRYPIDKIKERAAIAATRRAYKALGKDPNRYRPAAEQLCRRVCSGQELYRINPLVDLGNLISMRTGFSIGVFDYEAVGEKITLRRGTKEDAFEGIGRGTLNIEGLPTYTDEKGPFATPTSDHERTKVGDETQRALIFINDFGAETDPENECDRLGLAARDLREALRCTFPLARIRQVTYEEGINSSLIID